MARGRATWMGMKACRGSRWLGWAALLMFGAVCASLRAQTDGSLRWAFSTGNTGVAQVASSAAVGPDGTIYVGVELNTQPGRGRVFAIRPDGSRKWEFETPEWVDSSPAVSVDGTVYFGCWNGKLYALDAATGAKKWEFSAGTYILSSPAIGPDGTVYFGGGDSSLHAVSPAGVAKWSYTTGSLFVESSPAIAADGTVYFGANDRFVYALDATGGLKWRVATEGQVTSSPAIGVDGTVYIGSLDNRLYAISPSGVVLWTFRTGGQILASPVLAADGTIYIGSEDSNFYAIHPDGTMKWSVPVGGPILSSAAVRSDGTIIFGSYDTRIRALNPDTGLTKWAYKTGDPVEASPVIASDGTVYIGSLDGKLYAFNGSGAPASTYSRWPMFRRDSIHDGRAPALGTGGRLINIATRARAGNGAPLIVGLVTKGAGAKKFMIRAVGPTLAQLGLSDPLRDPAIEVKPLGSEITLLANDNWGSEGNGAEISATAAAVGAFALPVESKDAVVLGSLVGGLYTAAVGTSAEDSGVALVEAYDADANATGARLVNLSTRAQVGVGDNILIPGLVVGGSDPVRVLVRAVGPGLAGFGVEGALTRPTMSVFAGVSQSPMHTNSGWSGGVFKGDIAGAAAVVGAFPLEDGSADCAAIMTLSAGSYTIQVSGVNGTTGDALVEVYVLP